MVDRQQVLMMVSTLGLFKKKRKKHAEEKASKSRDFFFHPHPQVDRLMRALEDGEEFLHQLAAQHASIGLAASFYESAISAAAEGSPGTALRFFRLSRTTYRQLNDLHGEAQCLLAMGSLEDDLGNHANAVRLLEEALAMFQRLGPQGMVGQAKGHLLLAISWGRQGNVEKSWWHFSCTKPFMKELERMERWDLLHQVVELVLPMSDALISSNRWEEADNVLKMGLHVGSKVNDSMLLGKILYFLGYVRKEKDGNYEAARNFFENARKEFKKKEDVTWETRCILSRAEVELQMGTSSEAVLAMGHEALELAREHDDVEAQLGALVWLSKMHEQLGQHEESEARDREAFELYVSVVTDRFMVAFHRALEEIKEVPPPRDDQGSSETTSRNNDESRTTHPRSGTDDDLSGEKKVLTVEQLQEGCVALVKLHLVDSVMASMFGVSNPNSVFHRIQQYLFSVLGLSLGMRLMMDQSSSGFLGGAVESSFREEARAVAKILYLEVRCLLDDALGKIQSKAIIPPVTTEMERKLIAAILDEPFIYVSLENIVRSAIQFALSQEI